MEKAIRHVSWAALGLPEGTQVDRRARRMRRALRSRLSSGKAASPVQLQRPVHPKILMLARQTAGE